MPALSFRRSGLTAVILSTLLVLSGAPSAPLAVGAAANAGATGVFAPVPHPGQPAGIAVSERFVFVSTLGVARRPLDRFVVFVYDRRTGELLKSIEVPRMMPVNTMALYGLALDSARRLYTVDMNGTIFRIDPRTEAIEHYATIPLSVPGGVAAMPFDLTFDPHGNLYVSDQNAATIWRVSPGGEVVEPWFRDARLAGYLAGPSGIRIDPQQEWVYFTVGISLYPLTARRGLLFRLPLVSEPTSAMLEQVHSFGATAFATGITFGRSGALYVTLTGPDQVAVLEPDGTEHRFPTPEENAQRQVPFDDPFGVAFRRQGSLLVTNSAFQSDRTERMVVLESRVRDAPVSLSLPDIP